MGEVTSEKVTQFKGLLTGVNPQDSLTNRRGLDTPRELKNLIVNEFGHLWLPPAPDHSIADISALGGAAGPRVKKIAHTRGGFFLIHIGDIMYADDTQNTGSITEFTANLVEQFTFATKENPDPTTQPGANEDNRALRFSWTNAGSDDAGVGFLLVGNELETWKESGGWSDVSASNQEGPHSIVYKGRRFVAGGNVGGLRTVYYSDLNQPETFGVDFSFKLEGDAGSGSTLEQYTGHVTGFAVWEDLLVVFASQSIWVLQGTSPETFHLRKTASSVGCLAIESVVEVEGGLMFFGGIPEGEAGVYLFTGSRSELISQDISHYFREWDTDSYETPPASAGDQTNRNKQEDDAEWYFNAVRWQDYYILSAPTVDDGRQIFLYNTLNKTWTTFDGWGDAPRLGLEKKYYHPYSLILGNFDGKLWRATEGFPRPPAVGGVHQPATFRLGWYDQGHAAGLSRFLAVKVSAWKVGTGDPTIQLTANVPDGGQVVSAAQTIGDDVYDTIVFPLNLRGHGLTLDFDITPVNDDNEVTIEQVELISSRKGEKVSRG